MVAWIDFFHLFFAISLICSLLILESHSLLYLIGRFSTLVGASYTCIHSLGMGMVDAWL